ncbi:hypothetical protein H5V38_08830 [Fusobacterium hwasookii]|jgi:hypothetical protein|uniref:hypothetical protein n=1 Tax=Fusobacterium hwasookii TaxID=1583098 RepID=UPI0004962525|nr:hypothetical protein [Fusobacterium hwasookii]QNE68016.1 hypothetical protein H5V38_08830 [Fusobacterium hwasookii]
MNIDEDIKENLDTNVNEDLNLYSNNDFLLNVLINNPVNLYSSSKLDKEQISYSNSDENDNPLDKLELGRESDQGNINNDVNLYTNIDNATNENDN